MNLRTKHIIYTLQIDKIGKKTAFKIFDLYNKKEIKSNEEYISFILDISSNSRISRLSSDITYNTIILAINRGERILDDSEKQGISIITFFDKEYPSHLREQDDKPIVLNYKGNLSALTMENRICVIGTRNSTSKSNMLSKEVSYYFGSKRYNIISGLALGCDTYAHEGALDAKGVTTAVLGSGLNEIYPKENIELANRIVSNNGLLISEYFVNTKPRASNFIVRDTLQSVLSNSVVVIQSKIDGGSMYAANHAIKRNIPIGVIDYNINGDLFSGNKELVQKNNAFILDQNNLDKFQRHLKDYSIRSQKNYTQLDLFD